MIEIWIDSEVKYPIIIKDNRRMRLSEWDAKEILKIVEDYVDNQQEVC